MPTSRTGFTKSRIYQCIGRRVRSLLSFGLLWVLRFGPAGIAGWALKSVSRRPLKIILAVVLEPALMRVARYLRDRFSLH